MDFARRHALGLLAEEEPSDDPPRVRVDRRNRLPERHRRHGCRRVPADPGEPFYLDRVVRNPSVVVTDHRPGRLPERHGSAVVPQALPGGDDVAQAGPRERVNGGEASQERPVCGGDARGLRLLQHHL
jgi:hypothetical protein